MKLMICNSTKSKENDGKSKMGNFCNDFVIFRQIYIISTQLKVILGLVKKICYQIVTIVTKC